VRELREELGVDIAPPTGKALLVCREADALLEVWKVEEWVGDIVNAAPDEHDSLGWFSLEEAISLDLADAGYQALFEQVLT